MTTEAPPAATLGETIVDKLKASPSPLTLKEVSKDVPKLEKEKPAELEARVRAALEAEVGPARVFVLPSGKGGAARYWAKDERHLLRERAVELAAKPQALAALTKAVGKATKADPGFAEGVLRDLIGEGLLHQHETGAKGPLFGASPPPPPPPPVGETIVETLKASLNPLTLAELVKALPKPPKGVAAAAFKEQVSAALVDEVRSGRLFSAPSGKGGEARYWAKDEQHLVRERAVELAATPQALVALTKAVGKETKSDPGFVEGVLRDLIRDELLHEHPAKKGPLFGSSPPPPPIPPLEQPAGVTELAKVVKAVEAAMKKVGVAAEAVLAALTKHYCAPAPQVLDAPIPARTTPQPAPTVVPELDAAEIERRILDAVEQEGTMSLKDLRRQMPAGGQGGAFDRAVLGLEEHGRVSLSRDYDASHFGPEEQAEYVREGEFLYTSIAKRS